MLLNRNELAVLGRRGGDVAVEGREVSSAWDSYRSLKALTDRFSLTVGCEPLELRETLLVPASLSERKPNVSLSGLGPKLFFLRRVLGKSTCEGFVGNGLALYMSRLSSDCNSLPRRDEISFAWEADCCCSGVLLGEVRFGDLCLTDEGDEDIAISSSREWSCDLNSNRGSCYRGS
jgi:hypothetical protein